MILDRSNTGYNWAVSKLVSLGINVNYVNPRNGKNALF